MLNWKKPGLGWARIFFLLVSTEGGKRGEKKMFFAIKAIFLRGGASSPLKRVGKELAEGGGEKRGSTCSTGGRRGGSSLWKKSNSKKAKKDEL